MTFTLYCLYDKAAEFYSNVNQTQLTIDDLIESVRRDIRKDPNNKIYAQKELYVLGTYEDDTADIIFNKVKILDLDEELKKLKEVKGDVNSPQV